MDEKDARIKDLEAECKALRGQIAWILGEFRICRLCVYHDRECWPYQANCTPELDWGTIP